MATVIAQTPVTPSTPLERSIETLPAPATSDAPVATPAAEVVEKKEELAPPPPLFPAGTAPVVNATQQSPPNALYPAPPAANGAAPAPFFQQAPAGFGVPPPATNGYASAAYGQAPPPSPYPQPAPGTPAQPVTPKDPADGEFVSELVDIIDKRIMQHMKNDGFVAFAKSLGYDKDAYIARLLELVADKAPAIPKGPVTPEQMALWEAMAHPTYDDKFVFGGCLYCYKDDPPQGILPWTMCGEKWKPGCGSSMPQFCSAAHEKKCAKDAAKIRSTLNFDYNKFRMDLAKSRKTAATKKINAAKGLAPGQPLVSSVFQNNVPFREVGDAIPDLNRPPQFGGFNASTFQPQQYGAPAPAPTPYGAPPPSTGGYGAPPNPAPAPYSASAPQYGSSPYGTAPSPTPSYGAPPPAFSTYSPAPAPNSYSAPAPPASTPFPVFSVQSHGTSAPPAPQQLVPKWGKYFDRKQGRERSSIFIEENTKLMSNRQENGIYIVVGIDSPEGGRLLSPDEKKKYASMGFTIDLTSA